MHPQLADFKLPQDHGEPAYVILLEVRAEDHVDAAGVVVGFDELHEGFAVIVEASVDDDHGLFGASSFEVAVPQGDGIATARSISDRQEVDFVHV